jgi:hypothetical protein
MAQQAARVGAPRVGLRHPPPGRTLLPYPPGAAPPI